VTEVIGVHSQKSGRVHRQHEVHIGSKGSDGLSTAYGSERTSTTYEPGRWEDVDSDPDYAVFVCELAGFKTQPSRERRPWLVGDVELAVSVFLDKWRYQYVVWVHGGWPTHPAPKSLILAEVYAITVSGQIRVPNGPSLARWQTRALIDAGLVAKPAITMPTLPANAPASAQRTWPWIEHLLAIRAANGEPDAPLPLSAPFLEGWSGNTIAQSTIISAKRWYQSNGYIQHVADTKGSYGKPLQLWQVRNPSLPGERP
jgi:hypothetical protein